MQPTLNVIKMFQKTKNSLHPTKVFVMQGYTRFKAIFFGVTFEVNLEVFREQS